MLRARPPLPPLASLLRSYRRRVHWRGIVRCLSRDIGQPSHFTHPNLLREEEILPGMHKSEFAGRRTALLSELAKTHTGMTNDRHLVIIPAAPIKYMTADIPYRFHQNPDLLYLTGFQEPDSVLLLESSADHGPLPHHKAVLYVRPRNLLKELWDGPRAGTDDAVEFTGVDEAYTIDNLEQHLEKRYSQEGYTVWYYTESAIHPEHNKKIVASLTKSPGSRITSVHTPSHALNALRLVKSQSEIALMRKAGEIAATAFREVQ